MYRRSLLAVASLFFAAFMGFAAPRPALADPGVPAGLSYPIATTTAQGAFNGTLRIVSFAVQDGVLVASGIVSGTVTNAGGISAITQNVTIPVQVGAKAATAAAPAAASCGILNLVLGPLHLDLLGLVVDLNQVVLDITAVPGAGTCSATSCARSPTC